MTGDNLEQGTQTQDGGQTDTEQNPSIDSASQDSEPIGQREGQADAGSLDNSQGETQADNIVFDPQEFDRLRGELPNDLQSQLSALVKNLQGDYTRGKQSIADQRRKIEAYDSFQANPTGTVQQLAQQLGFKLVPMNNQQSDDQGGGYQGWTPQKGNPESWEDVAAFMDQQIGASIEKFFGNSLRPVYQKFQQMEKSTIENRLSEIDPSWRQYEQAMMDNLSKFPKMADNPDLLYRVSVPFDVLESRMTQKALAKMQKKTKASQVSGGSTTRNKAEGEAINNQPRSFEEAIELARAELAKQGIAKPSSH